ncbi:TIGR03086 family protein [Streptomyces sp. DvalAA-14]|uniref:TIGR03086 family metal-binding protein n=1 Tax=unclassified Streptomyces TaxID=2593676 RepID=UPI00081AFEB0|nr:MULTISPECIES: TIGR03086 family metal-binding protein [unclassified Streptomyces]MYS21629.1 TIGR03086 family protein [Streptomyces sp. SID4948]SCD97296.1 TIGR03086 family protein [Streptomyces sp. DvalAA-14]
MVGLTQAVRLLEDAVHYGLRAVEGVGSDALSRPTPCAGWDLDMLLCHVNESMSALREGAESHCIGLGPPDRRPRPPGASGVPDRVAAFRDGALDLLLAWRHRAAGRPEMEVGGLSLADQTVAFVGAVEIAVHGWDIAESCGTRRAIPTPLALAMLEWAPLFVDDGARPLLFAAPVPVPPQASPSDRLVAYLGRQPGS